MSDDYRARYERAKAALIQIDDAMGEIEWTLETWKLQHEKMLRLSLERELTPEERAWTEERKSVVKGMAIVLMIIQKHMVDGDQ